MNASFDTRLTRRYKNWEHRLNQIPESWFAWFGGWLSADGSIIKESKTGRVKIKFALCDRDPLNIFSTILGGRVSGPFKPSGLGKQPRFEWSISGWKAIYLLRYISGWLSCRYQKRAKAATKGFQQQRHFGRKLNPQKVAQIKSALRYPYHGIVTHLASQHGVTAGQICHIRQGRQW